MRNLPSQIDLFYNVDLARQLVQGQRHSTSGSDVEKQTMAVSDQQPFLAPIKSDKHREIVDEALEIVEYYGSVFCFEEDSTTDPFQQSSSTLGTFMGPQDYKGTKPVQKCISFAAYDEVIEIPHINDFSDDEIKNTWMSHQECQSMRKEYTELVNRMDEAPITDQKIFSFCTRGLESHTDLYRTRRKAYRRVMYDAMARVLSTHENNTGGDCLDAALLAEISKVCSASSVEAAKANAAWDQMQAIL
jgi:hypothetical protein